MIGLNHDVRVVNGRTLMLPAWKGGQEGYVNLVIPDIRDTDSLQKYPVGTKLLDGERVLYYAKASSVGVTNSDLGVKNGYRQHIAQRAIYANVARGAKSLIVVTEAGDFNSGVIGANALAGGFCVIFGGAYGTQVCRILENTATLAAGNMTLELQDEINDDLVVGTEVVECMAHPFIGCETNEDDEEPVVGVAQTIVTADYWFWLQTWGPCWLAPATEVGLAAHSHHTVFRHNGALDEHNDDDEYTKTAQHAGFTLSHAIGGGQAAPFLMLQICP